MLLLFYFCPTKNTNKVKNIFHNKVTDVHICTMSAVIILRPLNKPQKKLKGLKQPDAMLVFYKEKRKTVNKQS